MTWVEEWFGTIFAKQSFGKKCINILLFPIRLFGFICMGIGLLMYFLGSVFIEFFKD